MKPKNFNEG